MTEAPKTATEISADFIRLRCAIDYTLHRLRKFMRAYPREIAAKMPEHDVVWVTALHPHGGPDQAILEANKSFPELWSDAIPETVCIVPRKYLSAFGISDEMIRHLSDHGENIIAAHAGQHEYEVLERERERRSQ